MSFKIKHRLDRRRSIDKASRVLGVGVSRVSCDDVTLLSEGGDGNAVDRRLSSRSDTKLAAYQGNSKVGQWREERISSQTRRRSPRKLTAPARMMASGARTVAGILGMRNSTNKKQVHQQDSPGTEVALGSSLPARMGRGTHSSTNVRHSRWETAAEAADARKGDTERGILARTGTTAVSSVRIRGGRGVASSANARIGAAIEDAANAFAPPYPPSARHAPQVWSGSGRMQRGMTRKARETLRRSGPGGFPFMSLSAAGCANGGPISDVQRLRSNALYTSMNDSVDLEESQSLSSVLLKSLSKGALCDVEIVGKDEVPVEAPSYLLAVHSDVFERMLYSDKADRTSTPPNTRQRDPRKVELPFADYDTINTSVRFLATSTLPEELEDHPNEYGMRLICRIHLFGRLFRIASLENQAYRMARRMMNKAPRIACAALDECILLAELLRPVPHAPPLPNDELKAYALDFLRECPKMTLLQGGITFLNEDSIKTIIEDQEMDVDEHTMFHILYTWVKQDRDNIETGRALVRSINLSYIKVDYLNAVVRKCGFVKASDVDAALKDIDEMMLNRSPDEEEHVLVEGAGTDDVNGIYVRMEDDVGLGEADVMYVKEAGEDDSCPDFGLYLHRSTWAITTCVDPSTVLYSCEAAEGASSLRHRAPKSNWTAEGGTEPSPACTWNPGMEEATCAKTAGQYVAPNLTDGGRNNRKLADAADGDHDEGRKMYTLLSMLNLPTDEDHEEGDYHDDIGVGDSNDTSTLIYQPLGSFPLFL